MTDPPFELALRRSEIFDLRGRAPSLVLQGSANPRAYELALALVEAEQDGGAADVPTLRRALVLLPHPSRVRELLRVLEAPGFAVRAPLERWRAAEGVARATSRAELRRGRERLRAQLGDDQRLGVRRDAKVDEVRGTFASIEEAFEREDHAEVVRRVNGRQGDTAFLAALVRAVSPRHRSATRFLAHTLAGMSAMNLADVERGLTHLDRARADEEAGRRVFGPWVVRAEATRAALARMQAALVDDAATRSALLTNALGAWGRTGALSRDAGVVLLPEERLEFERWSLVERATPATLLLDLGANEGSAAGSERVEETARWLSDGEGVLGRYRAPVDSVISTGLIRARLAFSTGDLAGAEAALSDAEELSERPSTPRWVAGWVPRYLADLAFAEGQPKAVVGRYLVDAWERNAAHGFQRLLLVARVGAFDIGAEALDDLDVERAMARAVAVEHLRRRKEGFQTCPLCRTPAPSSARRALPRRARCALEIKAPIANHDVRALGIWR